MLNFALEGVHKVVGHTFLAYHHFLRALDDEVASLVLGAFSHLNAFFFIGFVKSAPAGPNHDWYVSQFYFRYLFSGLESFFSVERVH